MLTSLTKRSGQGKNFWSKLYNKSPRLSEFRKGLAILIILDNQGDNRICNQIFIDFLANEKKLNLNVSWNGLYGMKADETE